MNVVQFIGAYDRSITDPEALLDHHWTVVGWAEAVAATGEARVTVLQRFDRPARLSRNGVEYVFFRDGSRRHRRWRPSVTLCRHLIHTRPDVLHVRGFRAPLEAWAARQILRASTAIVMQDHGGVDLASGRLGSTLSPSRLVRRRAMRAVDGFLFTAAAQAEPWRRAGLVSLEQKVYEVQTASTVMKPLPRAGARERSGIGGDPAVLWVGRLNANKDPLAVLEGFERSLSSLPEATLTMIYGEDDLLTAVRGRIESSPALARRVRLVGRVAHEEIAAYFSAADLFVLGSHREVCGYALIEACACGAVPVVTDIPPFRRVTDGGAFGALWAPGDPSALARALVDAGRQTLHLVRSRMAAHFERALSWPAVGRRAVDIYRDSLSHRRAACR
ncbi:MAG TPA: glycosyltransferase family 4 protein [Vicinamibacterales bacterium]|nr:glycosyltransferase family 4 protein [Vicinamibacterales bacterium]